MQNWSSRQVYGLWAPVYDRLFRPLYQRARQRAIETLRVEDGERLLLPGIGTGLDLLCLPEHVPVVGVDLSTAMLRQARPKFGSRQGGLIRANAQMLPLPDGCFDAVAFNLILSVVPDGVAAFREGWRVLRVGGRAVIFDKFLPESSALTPGRRIIGWFVRLLGTDPNRRLSDILAGVPDLRIRSDKPDLLGGQYRIVMLERTG